MTPSTIGHFEADLGYAQEVPEVDWQGNVVADDRQTKICVQVPIRCVTDEKAVEIGIFLRVEIPMKRVGKIDGKSRAMAIAYAACREAIPRLARYAPWKLYDLNRYDISGDGGIPPAPEKYELKQDEPLSDDVLRQLTDATVFHRQIAATFEKAKAYLLENVDYLRHDPSRARSTARFIAECMRSDAAQNMWAWNREKSSGLIGDVDDLINRKNPSHPGYQRAAESIKSLLYRIHVPSSWAKYPPPPTFLDV